MNGADNARTMIDTQLVPRGIRDERVLAAIRQVPRQRFVPEDEAAEAYADYPLPIGEGQTISQPFMVAWMTEVLSLTGGEKVLEIGTGSGYQTAVLAELAQEVCTIERFPDLSARARKILTELGYRNIFYRVGDGTEGWGERAPFDRILITAASGDVPPPLFAQLADGGRIVLPLGDRYAQTLTIVEKHGEKASLRGIGSCVFVPLVGKYGMVKG